MWNKNWKIVYIQVNFIINKVKIIVFFNINKSLYLIIYLISYFKYFLFYWLKVFPAIILIIVINYKVFNKEFVIWKWYIEKILQLYYLYSLKVFLFLIIW